MIKVVWGRHWDPLLQADKDGILQARMDEVVDGEYQNYASRGGAYTENTSSELTLSFSRW